MKKFILAVALSLLSLTAFAAVDINTANEQELVTVKGIGAKRAQAIVEYRNQNGAFNSVDDLSKVKGFSAKTVEKMKDELTVSEPPKAAKKKVSAKKEEPKPAAKK
jgi:competence protein ComEA